METNIIQGQPVGKTETTVEEAAGFGPVAEAVGGAGAVVLAILGLAGTLPGYMMAISVILLGVAILFQGGSVAARYHRLIGASVRTRTRRVGLDVGGGMTAEALAGLAGIVLGIIALLGALPLTLCAIALIVFGAAELLGSAATSRYNAIEIEGYDQTELTRRLMHETVSLSVGGQVLIGIAAIVLGILALLSSDALALVLVGSLALGACILLSGSAIGARMLGILRHSHGA